MTITYAVGQRVTATLLQTLADYTVNKGLTRLVQQAAQSLTDNTDTALTFGAGSDDVDTAGWHDEVTNNTRITPTVAGYYLATGLLVVPAAADYVNLQVYIRKNGATILPSISRQGPNATSSSRSIQVTCDAILLNGSTDYLEAVGNQDNTASASRNTPSTGGSSSCLFTVQFIRPS
jgi:hypothetical protein